MAAAATGVYFTLFDPVDLDILGIHVAGNRIAAYTIGFFLFWLLCASSSILTCWLQRSADEINRCPLTAPERPPGCPKRSGSDAAC